MMTEIEILELKLRRHEELIEKFTTTCDPMDVFKVTGA